METSDESFAWTDASSDSSKEKVYDVMQNKLKEHSDESTACKKKAHNELPQTDQLDEYKQAKKRKKHAIQEEIEGDKNDYQLNRFIKSEPSSDYEVPKSNKRCKNNDTSISDHYNESLHEAEEYLNLRVKQEQVSLVEPTSKKKKKKYIVEPEALEDQEIEIHAPFKNEIDIEENHMDASSFVNGELLEMSEKDISKRKKKKKKKRSSVDTVGSEIFENQDSSLKRKKKKKDKELFENYGSDEHDFQNGEENSRQIISSTLLENSVQDNDVEQCNNDIQSASTLNGIKCSSLESSIKEKKSSRISDRIRFEDDSVDYKLKEYAPKIDKSIQLKEFISSNINLRAIANANLPNNAVLSDDEVWIVKGPHEISVRDFENTNLTLDGKRKVKLNGISYDIIIETSTSAVLILSLCEENKVLIKNTPLMGVINLHKRIPKVHIPYESLMTNNESSFIPLPDTKCRHPLFGINYKKAIKIPTVISEQLNPSNVLTNTESKKRKKKKIREKCEIESDIEIKPNISCTFPKKSKKIKEVKYEIESENETKPSIEVFHSKKKRNKKVENSPIQSDNEVNLNTTELKLTKKKRKHSVETAAASKKAKRAKLDLSGTDAWESEQAIEKTLFDF